MSDEKKLSRRDFLRASAMAALGAALQACAQANPAPTAAPTNTALAAAAATNTAVPAAPTATTAPAKPAVTSGHTGEISLIASGYTTLDTYLFNGGMYAQIFSGIKEGLVEFGPDLDTQVLQAESWEMSSDGLTYTFHLRKDNKWYDGTPVTAHDYVAAVLEQLTPGRDTKYGWDSPFGSLVNANDYNRGALVDVGVMAADDYTLVYTLQAPQPYFANALVGGSCYPLQKASVDKYGKDWVLLENFQGNGPYMISDWQLNESVTLVPNPNYNLKRGNLTKIVIKDKGQPLPAYQAGEIDFTGIGPVADLVVAQNDPALKTELVSRITSGMEWIRPLMTEDGFLYDNPKVVRAIAKSVDISKIVDPIFLGMRKAITQVFDPNQPGYDPALDDVLKPDVAAAKELLVEAGFPDGKGVPKLQLVFPSYSNQDYVSAWTAIAAEVQKNINVELVPNNMESGMYGQVSWAPLNSADLAGFCFYAGNRPWIDPLSGFFNSYAVRSFQDSKTYNTYANMVQEQRDIRSGVKKVEGGSDDDFAKALDELASLRSQAMNIYDAGNHPASTKRDEDKLFTNWIDTVTKARADAKAGTDAANNWINATAIVGDATAEVFLLTNRTADAWQIIDWQVMGLETTDPKQQADLNHRAAEMMVNCDWIIPCWLTVYEALVKPYVQGLKFNPFWWGQNLYLKWVDVL